jgi:hypothetical protein
MTTEKERRLHMAGLRAIYALSCLWLVVGISAGVLLIVKILRLSCG